MSSAAEVTPPPALARRTVLRGIGLGGAAAVTGLAAAPGTAAAAPVDGAAVTAAAAESTGAITAEGVTRGLAALPGIVDRIREQTGVPGLAVAVVYGGKVRYLAGVGPRQVGRTAEVDEDTVFQLASVSKPLSSTVVAAAFTQELSTIGWDDRVQKVLRGFTLSDPWVGRHVTVADLFAHRSGLPDHSGNLLEDLGYSRDEIIARHRSYPLRRFRDNWEYTNYGLTIGAEAVAVASRRSWEDLAQQVLFRPLGMSRSSYSFADLQRHRNRAALHRRVRGAWVADLDADYDAQAPAGSASTSIRDLATWLQMLLADGEPVTDREQLQRIWLPAAVRPGLPPIGRPPTFYGLGWTLGYEATGELRAGHSGAFAKGASTAVTVYPGQGLGVAVLSNSVPLAAPEAITAEFADVVRYGASTQDWVSVIAPRLATPETADQKKYSVPAASPAPARSLRSYTGRYQNRLYGELTVTLRRGHLVFTVGPAGQVFRLRHFSGDDFYFRTTGEDASGFSGAVFAGPKGRATSVRVNAWDAEGLGTFVRA